MMKLDVETISADYPTLTARISELAGTRARGERTRMAGLLEETAEALGVGAGSAVMGAVLAAAAMMATPDEQSEEQRRATTIQRHVRGLQARRRSAVMEMVVRGPFSV
jgi:hypothetical protein